jgi:hypothetical protein
MSVALQKDGFAAARRAVLSRADEAPNPGADSIGSGA